MTKQEICQLAPIGGWNVGLTALEVTHIDYGLENHLYCIFGRGETFESYHRLLVHISTGGLPYVLFRNRRYYLDQCQTYQH